MRIKSNQYNIVERVVDKNSWSYLSNEDIVSWTFYLRDFGLTEPGYNEYKNSFCLDGDSTDNKKLRVAIINDTSFASIHMIDWKNHLGQLIRIDKVNNICLITEMNATDKTIKSIIGCFCGHDEIYDSDEHNLPEGVESIEIDKDSYFSDCLFKFLGANNAVLRYYNPLRETSKVSPYSKECNAIKDIAFGRDKKELSEIFLRTEEDINALQEALFTRTELRSGSTELSAYLDIENSAYPIIIGVVTNSHNKGQVLKVQDGKNVIIHPEGTEDIFNLSNKVRTLSDDEYTFSYQLENDKVSVSSGLSEELSDFFNNSKLLKGCVQFFTCEDTLSCTIAFEDISYGARSFNSYYFIITRDEQSKKKALENRYYIMRYLLYLRSENENYANEQKRKQAINSAIAAIMSRNMSHNLGSHFLYYSQQDFSKLSDSIHKTYYLDSKTPEEVVFVQNNSLQGLLDKTKESFSYTKGAAKVFEFLQDRMYYLAAITGIDISQSLPVLLKSQILDFLTEQHDDYRNFYINNLVRSEQYTEKTISIIFENKDRDDINISLPLGSVSIHAIYNIFENFIRNSAKYQWPGIKKPQSLEFTIKVTDDNSGDIIIRIFDNKKSANRFNKINGKDISLLDYMNSKLEGIKFLDDDGSLNNDDKGLKEMLLSAFWINNRHGKVSIGDLVYELENSNTKRDVLKNYGIVFLSDTDTNDGNLGVEFHVNKHYPVLKYDVIKDKPYLTSDIVIVSNDDQKGFIYGREVLATDKLDEDTIQTLLKYVVESDREGIDFLATKCLLLSINKNLKTFIDAEYKLYINGKNEKYYYESKAGLPVIEFADHLSTRMPIKREELKEKYLYKPYYDSISGSNYTKQIDSFFKNATQGPPARRQYSRWRDKYTSLLIKESAITRITIIDERIFNQIRFLKFDSYQEGATINRTSLELDFRNIQVLNLRSSSSNYDRSNLAVTPNFIGNTFRNGEIKPHFISIHFGIIQQILKNRSKDISPETVTDAINSILSEVIISNTINNILTEDSNIDLKQAKEAIESIMAKIGCEYKGERKNEITRTINHVLKERNYEKREDIFSIVNSILLEDNYTNHYRNIRIAIHTGRGSLSKQEKEALNGYPIVPFGTLRAAFLNSKFILCQLFYNLKYKK